MLAPDREPVSRWSRLLAFLFPSLFCLIVYWPGLRAGFQMDDFSWLATMQEQVHDFHSFFSAVFRPLAQGSIRPLSERLFFFVGWELFGLRPLPFRLIAFATVFAALTLLVALGRRMTGSLLAGCLAAVLWIGNGNLYTPMSWSSAWNQPLCALFLLGALNLWSRWIDTREPRWYVLQFFVFVGGFSALELNVVYPVLALSYAWCLHAERRVLLATVPMFGVSAVYATVHRLVAPPVLSDTYRMYFDADIFRTLATYATWTVDVFRYASFRDVPQAPFHVAGAIAGVAVISAAIVWARRGSRLPAFAAVWFLCAIAPLLPLKNHMTDYYVGIPIIGIAIFAGGAIAEARGKWRVAAVVAAVAYLGPAVWMGRGMSQKQYAVSRRATAFVRNVAEAHSRHPGEALVIHGVNDELFWTAWWDNPFRLFGRTTGLYAGAESQQRIIAHRLPEVVALWFIPEIMEREGLRRGTLASYELTAEGRLANNSAVRRAQLEHRDVPLSSRLDVGNPLSDVQLGPGWWPGEGRHRWMTRKATVQLRGPRAAPGSVRVFGVVAADLLKSGPLEITVTIGGTVAYRGQIHDSLLDLRVPAPAADQIEVTLETDRAAVAGSDRREMSIAVGSIESLP